MKDIFIRIFKKNLNNERGSLLFFTLLLLFFVVYFMVTYSTEHRSMYHYYNSVEKIYREAVYTVLREQ